MEDLKVLNTEDIKELYKFKLSKYKDVIDDLTLQQKRKLYRMLLEETIIELSIEKLTIGKGVQGNVY